MGKNNGLGDTEIDNEFDIDPEDDNLDSNDFDDDVDDTISNSDLDPMNDLDDSDIMPDIDGSLPMEKHNDLLRELTNFSPYIKDKFKAWLGLVYNEKTGEYVPKEYSEWNFKDKVYVVKKVKPIMNLLCAEWCINFLRDYTRNNNILTSLDEEEYKLIISDVVDNAWLSLVSKRLEFAILDDDIYSIAVSLEHAVRLVLTGAAAGGYRKVFTDTTNRSESINLNNDPNNEDVRNNRKKDIGFLGSVRKSLLGGK